MELERRDGGSAVAEVALMIAVGEPGCDVSQVSVANRLTAQRTERLRPGTPASHHDEFHVPPPKWDVLEQSGPNNHGHNVSAMEPAEPSGSVAPC